MTEKSIKVRLIVYLVLEIAIVACVLGALSEYSYTAIYNWVTGQTGILEDNAFSRFTTLSNLFLMVSGVISTVFCVKALINKKYELPRWVVSVKYLATVYIVITFITICLILSWISDDPGDLWDGREFFTHVVDPFFGVAAFCVLPNQQPVNKFLHWYALIPVICYSVLYGVMTIGLGTWEDFYSISAMLPWSAIIFAWAILGFSLTVSYLFFKAKFHKTIAKTDKV